MGTINETVRITIQTINKGTKVALKNANASLTELRWNMQGFNQVMGQNMETFKSVNKANVKYASTGARVANRTRQLAHGMRGFRMEMLGVMFFGMAIQRLFVGLLKPSLELVGMFDLWRTTLEILFLPIAMMLFEFLLPLMMWLMNLSESTKLMIGKLVLFAAAIGAVLFIVGTLALGIGALIMAFGGIFTIIDKLIPDMSFLGFNISSAVEAGLAIGLVAIAFKAFKGIAEKVLNTFLEMSFIKDLFEDLEIEIDDNKTAWDNFKVLVSGVIDKIKKKLDLSGEFGGIGGMINEVKTKGQEWLDEFKEKITELDLAGFNETIKEIGTTVDDIAPSFTELAKELVPILKFFNDILSKAEKMYNFLKKPFPGAPEGKDRPELDLSDDAIKDFISGAFTSRPGLGPIGIHPDTITPAQPSQNSTPIIINQTNTVSSWSKDEIDRVIYENNIKMTEQIKRLTGVSG